MRENKRYLLVVGKNLRENVEKAILDLGFSEFTEIQERSYMQKAG